MNCSNSEAQLSDLKAMNSVKQRDVTYEDYQRKDQNSQSLVNSMNAHVYRRKGQKGSCIVMILIMTALKDI